MKAKKRTQKKRSNRLKGKPLPEDSLSDDKNIITEDDLFPFGDDTENDIIDTDEMEDFNYRPDDEDDSEW
jgi:hypothetical protein|uniref:Uncharacterized protein n=1 Tax=candidate division WOR-3 bacterium TaxID=2052148 RepID=A0A7V3PSF7_UNCW3